MPVLSYRLVQSEKQASIRKALRLAVISNFYGYWAVKPFLNMSSRYKHRQKQRKMILCMGRVLRIPKKDGIINKKETYAAAEVPDLELGRVILYMPH